VRCLSALITFLSAFLLLLCCPAPASARNASTTISVSAMVIPSCVILSHANLDFGQVTVPTSQVTAVAQFDLSCTQNTTGRIGIDSGLNASATQRRLQLAPNITIPYSLWQDPAHTTEWRNTDPNRLTFIANPPHQSRNIYGVLQPQPGMQPGLYTDVITVTIEF